MLPIKIVAADYRCFGRSAPLELEFDRGFTSLVGPNNSGKSTAIRLVYEFRGLFNLFVNFTPAVIQSLASGKPHAHPFAGVTDPVEPFNDSATGPIDLSISWQDHNVNAIDRINISFFRRDPGSFAVKFFAQGSQISFDKIGGIDPFGIVTTNNGKFNFSSFRRVFDVLQRCLYIGAYRNAINEGSGKYYDLDIGTAFIKTWDDWKSSGKKWNAQAIKEISEDIRRIFDFKELEINSSNTNKEILIMVDRKQYRLSELGAGFSQFLIVLGNVAISKPSFILIDEPELNLHPSLQIDFLTSVGRHAELGTLFTSHSLGLARSVSERILSSRRENGLAITRPLPALENYAEFLGEMSFSAFRELGCDKVLLVEGVKDLRVLQQLLRKRQKDHEVVIVPLGGDQLARGGVEQELSEFMRISKKVFALVDSEKESPDGEIKKQRMQFLESCKRLGIDCVVTERRALENYFSERAVKNALGEQIAALGPYERLDGRWSKSDNWLIASHLDWSEIERTDVGALISRL